MNVRTRVLRVAKERFLKYGFYKVSMDSLVKELRTSKSSLYNHFDSKEELVKAVMESLNNEINAKLEEILDDDQNSFKGKLDAISDFTRNLLLNVSEEFLKDLEINTPDIWDEYQKNRIERINKYYRRLFQIGIDEGIVKSDVNLDVIIAIYFNLMELPLKNRYIDLLNMNSQDIYTEVTNVFLNGIMVD
ncbi:MAG: TetR/AcrR family transcriptional regulator [Bacteroidota bacterium]|uniref:TetR/AcrR family transcriptional regulator n=1 Tax=Flagellimonas profundi TaxID=2915620 RepID=A0ABS3FHB8_9FLAO|nr:TetR/AcrR family transcriptional regulator [Allomuricauda profundi]MBO0342560.1 TetR/AcrR family transcriptional regulator [Allomuricauda profundi]MEC7770846.1 TetR/AcrR family transcriptional regulator [Bacteroidota bacterium]